MSEMIYNCPKASMDKISKPQTRTRSRRISLEDVSENIAAL